LALTKEPAQFVEKLHEGAKPGSWRTTDELWLTAKAKLGSLTAKDLEPVSS